MLSCLGHLIKSSPHEQPVNSRSNLLDLKIECSIAGKIFIDYCALFLFVLRCIHVRAQVVQVIQVSTLIPSQTVHHMCIEFQR